MMENTATIPNDERNEPIEGIDDLGKFSAIASGQRDLTIEEQKILVRFHALSILRSVSFWLAGVAPKQYRNAKLGPFLIDKLRDQARQISDAISIIEDLAAEEIEAKGVNCADAEMPDMPENDQSEVAVGSDGNIPVLAEASSGICGEESHASDQPAETVVPDGPGRFGHLRCQFPLKQDDYAENIIWTADRQRFCDIRGWGYLTGPGGLYLDHQRAAAIQDARAKLLVDAVNDYISRSELN